MSNFPNIQGLNYLPNFVSAQEENLLLRSIDNEVWRDDLRRRVQHYGYIYDYRSREISKDMRIGSLPSWSYALISNFINMGLFTNEPDQMIVNEYLPGQGISPHIDCLPCFGGTIASLSLGARITMSLTKGPDTKEIRLDRCSLLVLSGEARTLWRHGIASRKTDLLDGIRVPRQRRVSLTFRTVQVS